VSYKLVDLCFDIPGLTQSEQSVLLAICRYADNHTHDCSPSLDALSQVSRLDKRQVSRILSTLLDKKLLTYIVGKGRKSNIYTVQVAVIRSLVASGDTTPPQVDPHSTDIRPPLAKPAAKGDSLIPEGESSKPDPKKFAREAMKAAVEEALARARAMGLFPRRDRVQVLPHPSIAPRIQRPTRRGPLP
jgi:hypothetical protein